MYYLCITKITKIKVKKVTISLEILLVLKEPKIIKMLKQVRMAAINLFYSH